MKPSHIPTLLELLQQGAKDRPVAVTTTQLAGKLGKSQQLASKHLDEMEKDGLIERIRSGRKTYVKLTRKGVSAGASLYSTLEQVFGGKDEEALDVNGVIFSGLGEGAYYVSLKGYNKQFVSKLGFDPYPGTLNLRLDSAVDRKIRRDLAVATGINIEGFRDGKRTYGGAQCFRAIINGKAEGAVLVIERTTHDDTVMEIISPTNIRDHFRLKDGDVVKIIIYLKSNSKAM
ncbi:MAG: DUF120 domain-containing protein [Nitrososphaerales archaeon]